MRRRIFPRRRRRHALALLAMAVVLPPSAGLLALSPLRVGWVAAEKAGWIAGIVAAALGLASFVGDRVDARRQTSAGPVRTLERQIKQVGRVPRQAAWFQQRRTHADVTEAVGAGGTAVLTQVLSGLGGVGKTQLAAQFTRGLEESGDLDLRVWITASSRDAIIAGYAESARAVGIADLTVTEQAAADRLLTWLERADRRWLIVLDNLDTPGDAAGLWPPDNRYGRTVVTTRRRDPVLDIDGRSLIIVDLFTPDEAVRYLEHATGAVPKQRAEVEGLAADLGYLPLAVAQAAAFIRDRGIDCGTYRRRLADRRSSLQDLAPPADALPDDYRTTVAATWTLSVDAADDHPPHGIARPLLEIAALLDPNGIPVQLLTTGPVMHDLAIVTGREVDAQNITDGIRNLHRLSLLVHDFAIGAVRVHALVQRASRDQASPDRVAASALAAASALQAIWPRIERDPSFSQILRTNTMALRRHIGDDLITSKAHEVLFLAASSLGHTGLVKPARDAFEQLYDDCLRLLGRDHPDTLFTRSRRARWGGAAGDPVGAAAAYEQLLIDRIRVLGLDHRDTLATRHNIAYWRGKAGDPAGAAAAFEQLLTGQLRVLGPDHPDTLATRHNIARWHGETGDLAGAVAALEELLPDQLRVLGRHHPDTLATRHNLAFWRGKGGDPAGAAAGVEELLADQVLVFGPDHPDTLTTRHNLARWRGEAGDRAGAAAALEHLLSDQLRVLGPEHPDTLISRGDLAVWLAASDDSAAAAATFEALLADQLRVLGPDHQLTLNTRGNVIDWHGQAGDPDGAATAFAQLFSDQQRVLGPDHPDTLTTRSNLAYWCGAAGDPAAAAAAFEELLNDELRVLGADHPDTLTTRHNLAAWRGEAGDAAGAAIALKQLIDDELRILGPGHPDVQASKDALAHWHREADRFGEPA